jgi:uncharacterized protein YhfF
VKVDVQVQRRAEALDQRHGAGEPRGAGEAGLLQRQIFALIRAGDKTGTFTLPSIVECTGLPVPKRGDQIVLIDFDGTPTMILRLTDVRSVVFGEVTADDTAIDGSPVRDPAVWKPLHTAYWGAMLAPFGLVVSDDMPFWAEPFELLFDRGAVNPSSQAPRS